MKDSPEGAILMKVTSYCPGILKRGHVLGIHTDHSSTTHFDELIVMIFGNDRTSMHPTRGCVVVPFDRVACEY